MFLQIAFPFLVLSAVVVPLWLAIRFFRYRKSSETVRFGREVLLLIFIFYLVAVISATLSPNRNSRLRTDDVSSVRLIPDVGAMTCMSPDLRTGSNANAFCIQNSIGNVLLFLPFGFLVPVIWKRLRLSTVFIVAVSFSVGIELSQLATRAIGSYRSTDVNDVILNAVGASCGVLICFLLRFDRNR